MGRLQSETGIAPSILSHYSWDPLETIFRNVLPNSVKVNYHYHVWRGPQSAQICLGHHSCILSSLDDGELVLVLQKIRSGESQMLLSNFKDYLRRNRRLVASIPIPTRMEAICSVHLAVSIRDWCPVTESLKRASWSKVACLLNRPRVD
jgi:hypothetical protein